MKCKNTKLVYSTRPESELAADGSNTASQSLPSSQQTIKIFLDRKRRRGKTVTVAQGFQLTQSDLKSLQKVLKQTCGAGGTSKGDEIEIQGDHRDKVIEKLLTLNYKVKRAGG